ncbi:hypothetical protein B8W66_02210 [Mycobacterium decipiens]|uniref:Uncharacterized protein n=1 Tax=Mycobacterium decipiens TaxID=1430326 RepID=A0A1X2M0S3_9MYCO|nr:hypothetical protein B8W66_02210 [Mycobacterium decipiens]
MVQVCRAGDDPFTAYRLSHMAFRPNRAANRGADSDGETSIIRQFGTMRRTPPSYTLTAARLTVLVNNYQAVCAGGGHLGNRL